MKPLRAARPATAARTASLFERDDIIGEHADASLVDDGDGSVSPSRGTILVEADSKDIVDAALALLTAARDGVDDGPLQAKARALRFALAATPTGRRTT